VTNRTTTTIQYIYIHIYRREYLNLNYMCHILQLWTWGLMWLPDLTTFRCEWQYLPNSCNLLRYLYNNNLYTIYFHPDQYKFNVISYFLSIFNIYIYIYIYVCVCVCIYIYIYSFLRFKTIFYVHPVSNMGSHSTWYALTVPHISECWPGDGLIREKYVVTIRY
jgi:hypothetical protein